MWEPPRLRYHSPVADDGTGELGPEDRAPEEAEDRRGGHEEALAEAGQREAHRQQDEQQVDEGHAATR